MKTPLFLFLFACLTLRAFSQNNVPVDVYVINPNGCPYTVTTTYSNQYLGAGSGTLVGIDTLSNQEVYHFLVPDTLSATYFTVCAIGAPPCTCPNACAGPMQIYANIAITLMLCPTSVTELSTVASIELFPNPAEDVINIKSDEAIRTVSVYDVAGRCVKTSAHGTTQVVIDCNDLTSGLYFVNVDFGDGNIVREKIMIR
jgi:hypothetical protein